MQEELITFETAKLAKEKGFDVTVPQGYNSEELDYQRFGLPKGIQFGICTNTLPTSFTAPSQSLLQRWLREVYNIHIAVLPKILPSNEIKYYCFKGKIKKDFKDLYNTYEEALEDGLQEALKLINNE